MIDWLRTKSKSSSSHHSIRPRPRRFLPSVEPLEGRELLSTFTVTSNADSGPGTLRQAILNSNANPGTNTITFALKGSATIMPTLSLPTVKGPVVIDGTSQPGYAGHPLVVLDGSSAGNNNGAGAIGLNILGNVTVRGLDLEHWTGPGIETYTDANLYKLPAVITGCYIGTDPTHTFTNGNYVGVEVVNGGASIGGTASGAGNRITFNKTDGVLVGPGAGATTIVGNMISGNTQDGVLLQSSFSTVQDNVLGTNLTGAFAVPNAIGVVIEAPSNLIGGTTTGVRNVISGNSNYGLEIFSAFAGRSPPSGNLIEGNYIGTNAAGSAAVPNLDGVVVNGSIGNTLGGAVAGAGNVISGNTRNGVYLLGNAVGVGNNLIQGNHIGTNAAGSAAVPNFNGILIGGSSDNTIGGAVAGAGNLISGNSNYGVELGITTDNLYNRIEQNYIGTNAAGTAALPNLVGVVLNQSSANTVGGAAIPGGPTLSSLRNVISGNTLYGIVITGPAAQFNSVEGNYIGVTGAGSAALSNGIGIQIASSGQNIIGGEAQFLSGNVISGNYWYGVQITGTTNFGNYVEANIIGLSADHQSGLPSKIGVYLQNASNNTIGGITTGAGNIIAENGWGVRVQGGLDNLILRNSIFGNTVLGIQLLNGGNNNQPAPVLSTATNSGGTTTVSGMLSGAANTTYVLEFFWTPAHFATGADVQGKTFVVRVQVSTNASGLATFSIALPFQVPLGDFVTATATDPNGNTSQFSNGMQVQ
jgi:titin